MDKLPIEGKLCCPISPCVAYGFRRQTDVNDHLREVHRVPLLRPIGGQPKKTHKTQRKQWRTWLRAVGFPVNTPLFAEPEYNICDSDGSDGEGEGTEDGQEEKEDNKEEANVKQATKIKAEKKEIRGAADDEIDQGASKEGSDENEADPEKARDGPGYEVEQ
ncbi:hypothetical protein LTR37_018787 [Vermiconidia calcicola]|uniref:Uncharacterized protein n=1 Tax=Vermiconidia calcicola TaxID=1690605 RepID=A0ACC3MG35_9PEZI|nr:hypothetical protein LTR37_018787 [Vermiconidia calcicola]